MTQVNNNDLYVSVLPLTLSTNKINREIKTQVLAKIVQAHYTNLLPLLKEAGGWKRLSVNATYDINIKFTNWALNLSVIHIIIKESINNPKVDERGTPKTGTLFPEDV